MSPADVRARTFLAPALLLLLAALALAGCSSQAKESHNDADVAFATQMIPHHAQALQMADMTIGQRGVSAGLGRLAERIRQTQRPEIDTMEGWLKDWGQKVPQTGYGTGDEHNHHEGMDGMGAHAGPGMMTAHDMAALGKAHGSAFERMWLRMMIEHHQGAIAMARTELDDGEDPDAEALARDIVAGQQAEIAKMRTMLRAVGAPR